MNPHQARERRDNGLARDEGDERRDSPDPARFAHTSTGGRAADRSAHGEMAGLRAREARLRAYARLLDSAIRLPGGFRVGLDGLIGLVPVVGDVIGLGLSSYLVIEAARLGIPRSVVMRMIVNIIIETTIGAVPIVGDAFDFFFKANERNVRLLERELDLRERSIGSHTPRVSP